MGRGSVEPLAGAGVIDIPARSERGCSERVPWVVRLAGRVSVTTPDRVVDARLLFGCQGRLVLAMLVLERRRPVPRAELADLLWPDGRIRTWEPAVRCVVSKVRAFLIACGLAGTVLPGGGDGTYQLQLPDGVEVDIESADSAVAAARRELDDGHPRKAGELAEQARGIATMPFLPDAHGEWVEGMRDRMRETLLWSHCVLGEAYTRDGRHELALQALGRAIELAPFREPTYRLLMRAHMAAGNRAEAVRAYHRCRGFLADELGVEPAADTTELHLALLRNQP
jgi:DNA-binding SARP family transcriptional activator